MTNFIQAAQVFYVLAVLTIQGGFANRRRFD